jgi:hypothetical protein
MFFGERLDNVKIIGNGHITGNGNLVTGDNVMRNAPDNRADKMFALKLCTNLEIGGIYREGDLWYDPVKDEPYYIKKDGSKDFDTDNMLKIDRAGHFVLLATGTDNINVHNTYFAKHNESNVRDIYDFMACSNVTVTNIYSRVSSDDIIKPGSDCSLGLHDRHAIIKCGILSAIQIVIFSRLVRRPQMISWIFMLTIFMFLVLTRLASPFLPMMVHI